MGILGNYVLSVMQAPFPFPLPRPVRSTRPVFFCVVSVSLSCFLVLASACSTCVSTSSRSDTSMSV